MLHTKASLVLLCAATVAPAASQAASEVRPAREALDKTGVAWVLPFAEALARARAEQRLVFVPVIAGGSEATGCW